MQLQYGDIDVSLASAKLEELGTNNNWDYYGYREYEQTHGHNAFDTIIDIGANSGSIGLMTRIRFPISDLYSFEPNPIGYASNVRLKSLFSKQNGRRGAGVWEVYNLGLGDGNPVYLQQEQESNNRQRLISDINVPQKKSALGAVFAKSNGDDSEGDVLETITFTDLLKLTNTDLTKNISLKIDCECCESWLYSEENLKLLRNFRHITGEMHFPPKDNSGNLIAPDHPFSECGMCVSDEIHREALNSLSDVFDVCFFKGSLNSGICHFILTRKEDNFKGLAGVHY